MITQFLIIDASWSAAAQSATANTHLLKTFTHDLCNQLSPT